MDINNLTGDLIQQTKHMGL